MWSIKIHPTIQDITSIFTLIVMGAVLFLTGCSLFDRNGLVEQNAYPYQQGVHPNDHHAPFNDPLQAAYTAADRLCDNLNRKKGTILAASFVNIDHLEQSSTLGRLLSEQIASRMAQNKFKVFEMKLRYNSIYIKKGRGEFMLSREIQKISQSHNSRYVLVGTYAVAEMSIYICARIVDTADNTIKTGYNFQIERNAQTESLLWEN